MPNKTEMLTFLESGGAAQVIGWFPSHSAWIRGVVDGMVSGWLKGVAGFLSVHLPYVNQYTTYSGLEFCDVGTSVDTRQPSTKCTE